MAEEALRRSEALKSAMLESALDCVITMDHEGRVLEFNPAAEATFGISEQQAVGREMAQLIIPPDLRDAHRAGLARYLEGGESAIVGRRVELRGMRADGTEFPIELVRDPDRRRAHARVHRLPARHHPSPARRRGARAAAGARAGRARRRRPRHGAAVGDPARRGRRRDRPGARRQAWSSPTSARSRRWATRRWRSSRARPPTRCATASRCMTRRASRSRRSGCRDGWRWRARRTPRP